MASPCEVLVECESAALAGELCALAQQEAMRIEQKFSRYRDDNIVHRMNNGTGEPLPVDAETARLLDFAQHCYQLSDGYFDITSGILRRAWQFTSGARIPRQRDIDKLLPLIGWDKIRWQAPELEIPEGMEIDFGGIGKEYAVDSVHQLLKQATGVSFMVNFGGDCTASGPLADGSAWMTGIENPHRPGDASAVIQLKLGALATSGDVFKFIRQGGKRYGHILNPRTGWPNPNSPLSVTIAAPTCTEAGILSTLAMLQGKDAEKFLDRQGFKYWCYR
ncbi:MAG: FAD:protein FMN transferase [Gammaproteobacteria bacterium]|jgi:thiamine biosynthesis lipoprotein|nr:FAD:protein FMN transferase [Gammaproteobacteria bacterium]